jgi:sugar phosphate isomerase/epimerase
MKLQFFVPRWGSENLSWDEFLLKAKNAGFNGIECGIPNESLLLNWIRFGKRLKNTKCSLSRSITVLTMLISTCISTVFRPGSN